METRKTTKPDVCSSCNWFLYKEQECPVRITEEKVEFYCSERCYKNQPPSCEKQTHSSSFYNVGPVS